MSSRVVSWDGVPEVRCFSKLRRFIVDRLGERVKWACLGGKSLKSRSCRSQFTWSKTEVISKPPVVTESRAVVPFFSVNSLESFSYSHLFTSLAAWDSGV